MSKQEPPIQVNVQPNKVNDLIALDIGRLVCEVNRKQAIIDEMGGLITGLSDQVKTLTDKIAVLEAINVGRHDS